MATQSSPKRGDYTRKHEKNDIEHYSQWSKSQVPADRWRAKDIKICEFNVLHKNLGETCFPNRYSVYNRAKTSMHYWSVVLAKLHEYMIFELLRQLPYPPGLVSAIITCSYIVTRCSEIMRWENGLTWTPAVWLNHAISPGTTSGFEERDNPYGLGDHYSWNWRVRDLPACYYP